MTYGCWCGRTLNERHPVCVSCKKQKADTCRKPKQHRPSATTGPAIIEGAKAWVITGADLPSPNEWVRHPQSRQVYISLKKKWKGLVAASVLHFGPAQGQRSLRVVRWIKDKRSLYDEDNLVGGLKPIIDSLVKEGVFHDDTPQWLQLEKPDQQTGSPRVEIVVTDLY